MESFFSKAAMFFATLLASVDGSSYLYLEKNSIEVKWSTGSLSPVINQIALKNTSDQSLRYSLTSSNTWLKAFREGQPGVSSFNIFAGGALNVILEVYPGELSDGVHVATVRVDAITDLDSVVKETEVINVTVYKNYVSGGPSVSPTITVSHTPTYPDASITPGVTYLGPPVREPTPSVSARPNASQTPKTANSAVYSPAVTTTSPGDNSAVIDNNSDDEKDNIVVRFIKRVLSIFGFGD